MTKATGIKPFARWLDAEYKRIKKENDRLDAMDDVARENCCDNHSAHEEAMGAKQNEIVKVINRFEKMVKIK